MFGVLGREISTEKGGSLPENIIDFSGENQYNIGIKMNGFQGISRGKEGGHMALAQ